MPWRNRVLPTGELIHHPDYRGAFMGNRGILHDAQGRLTPRRWTHKAWVTCALSFKGRRRHPLMQPGRYTELFFHDEAVAFAAGHRPCGECRRADYGRFRQHAGISGRIADFDRLLHAARVRPQRDEYALADLPDGVFVLAGAGLPHLVLGDAVLPFERTGYGAALPRPAGAMVQVLTPRPLVEVLRAGYRLMIAGTPWPTENDGQAVACPDSLRKTGKRHGEQDEMQRTDERPAAARRE